MSGRFGWLRRYWRQLQRKGAVFGLGAALGSPFIGNPSCRNCHTPTSGGDDSSTREPAEWACMTRGTRSVACHFWAPAGHKGYACITAKLRCAGASDSIEMCSGTLWTDEHKRIESAFDASVNAISECKVEYSGPGQYPERQQEALTLEAKVQAECDQRITAWRGESDALKMARVYEHMPKACKLRLEVR